MDFGAIIKLIADAGVSVACSAVLIFVFWKVIERQLKDSEEARKVSDEQNRQILKKLLEYTPYSITPKKYDEDVVIDREINEILKKLFASVNPTRVVLVTFHNGGKDLSGLSFLKMSMRNEVTGPNIKPMQSDFQNVFRNTLAYWCNELAEKGYCYVENYQDIEKVDRSFYDFMSARGVTSMYGKSIVNSDNHIIGFIGIEYMSKPEVDLDRIEHCLNDKKMKVETLLNYAIHNVKPE